MRRLLRDHSPLFLLTQTEMHQIDPQSPLLGATARESLGNAGLSNGGAKKSADGGFVSLLGRNQALDC